MTNTDTVERLRELHPGSNGVGCPLQIHVSGRASSGRMSGYACAWTGGHCLPGSKCDTYQQAATLATLKGEG